MRLIALFLTVLIPFFYSSDLLAIERAGRISDREIIESLAEIRGDIKRLEEGQKNLGKRFDDLTNTMNRRFDDMNNSVNRRFDDMNNSVNSRFDDIMGLLQILAGSMLVVGGGILGWLVVIWRKLIRVEERQMRFETQDDEIKFLKEAYNRLNEMVLRLMDALKPPKGVL